MEYADEVMRREGVVLSRLHTQAQRYAFYGRCGYVKAIHDTSSAVMATDALDAADGERAEEALGDGLVREAKPRDATRLNEIYVSTFRRAVGHVSRNEHFFLRRIAREPKLWYWRAPLVEVVEDPDAGVIAYLATDLEEDPAQVVELATLEHHGKAARALVVHAARRAHADGRLRLEVHLDAHGALGWLVREFRMVVSHDTSVVFLKAQDEVRLVELVKPLIERAARREQVRLRMKIAGIGEVCVGEEGIEVTAVSDVQHLATLVYNGAWFAGLVGQGALTVEPDTRAAHDAVRRVFPDTHARRCKLDAF
jgi:hypothetical protein